MMPFGFAQPLLLGLLVLVPVAFWLHRRGWSDLAPWRRRAVLGSRLLEIALLALALAGLRWERAGEEVCVLFALDASRSVPESSRQDALAKIAAAGETMRPDDRAGLIVFGRQPLVEAVPQARLRVGEIQSRPDENFTNLAAALRLAGGLFPDGMRRRLVLFSDGNENRGDALEALRAARAAGIVIDVFPIEAPPRQEVSLTRLDVPGRVERDEAFELRVEVVSTHDGPATLRFFRDGAPLGRQEILLKAGRTTYAMSLTEDRPGFHTYEAFIESPHDVEPENNMAGAFTQVAGPSRLLLVGPEDDLAALGNALRLARLDHDRVDLPPTTLAALQAYDAIVVANVPAHAFGADQVEEVERYVHDLGGGLAMIGGENSFGPGGWIGTAVERALPVRMELTTKEKFPSLGLVMVIDKSGSMGGAGSGFSKMDMANRAAVEAIGLLGPKDLVGVVAFDSAAKWVVRLGPATDPGRLSRDVLSITAGGGTDVFQGALLAYEALAGAETKIKHVIVLTDGQTPPADFEGLAQRMRAAGITLSTVAIGSDADAAFLEGLARMGNGRFYDCPDPARIPRIFVRETILVQRSYLMEETVQPTQVGVHPILADSALRAMPPLHGWVVTELKSRAEPVLALRDDPLLATWQHGLGKSLAFTSDARPRWARDWTGWGNFQTFWDRTLRWMLRGVPSVELHPRIVFEGELGRLEVQAATLDGQRLNFLGLKARLVRPDYATEELPLRQIGVGLYHGEFAAGEPGAYLAAIFDEEGRQASAGGMVAFSPEFKDFSSNEYLLAEMAHQTGGKVNPTLDEIFRRQGPPVRSAKEIWQGLLAAALLLLLVEVGLRRLHLDEEQRARLRAALARWAPKTPWATAMGPGVEEAGLHTDLKQRSLSVKRRLQRRPVTQSLEGFRPEELGSVNVGQPAVGASPGVRSAPPAGSTPGPPMPEGADALLAVLRERRRARPASQPGPSPRLRAIGGEPAPPPAAGSAADGEASAAAASPSTPPPPVRGESSASHLAELKRRRKRGEPS